MNAETVEAIRLLNDLGKPVDLICQQLELQHDQVAAVIRNKSLSPVQRTLFDRHQ